jgi:hypothetical protein
MAKPERDWQLTPCSAVRDADIDQYNTSTGALKM